MKTTKQIKHTTKNYKLHVHVFKLKNTTFRKSEKIFTHCQKWVVSITLYSKCLDPPTTLWASPVHPLNTQLHVIFVDGINKHHHRVLMPFEHNEA